MDYLRTLFSFGRDSRQDNCKNDEDGIPQVATTPTVTKSSSVLADNPFSKYGLSCPPQGENPQTLPRSEKLIKRDGFGKYLKAHNSNKSDAHTEDKKIKARCLVFLYGRGFYVHAKKKKRVEKIESILNKPSAIKRLVRLVESEGTDRDITESREGLYLRQCQTLHRYFQQEGSFGFLSNQNEAADYFFRIQRQGNCFMHSACVIIPYLFQSRDVEGGYPVDLSKFVRHAFTDKELYADIVVDAGGKGVDVLSKMLNSLLADKPAIATNSSHQVNSKDYDLEELLEKFGPGLVTGFDCNRHFENEDHENNKDKIGYLQFQGKRHHSRGKFVDLFARPGDILGDANYKQSVEITLDKYKSSHNANGRVHPIFKPCFQIKMQILD